MWKQVFDESLKQGFKGVRAVSETECFFKNEKLMELGKYEASMGKRFSIPLTSICAYRSDLVLKAGGEILMNLLANLHFASVTAY